MCMMIPKIISALILGFLFTIASLQYDPHIQEIISNAFVREFERALDCALDYESARIDLFCPTIELHNVRVRPRDESTWHWTAKKYTTRF